MVKKLSLSVVFAILVSMSGVRAQEVKYPETVKALFQKADLEISEGYGILRFAQNDTRDVFLKPRIAVPDIEEADLIRQMVMKAGGEAVDMPGKGCSSVSLRVASEQWDGAALPDGWVKTSDEYSLLVYKTITDRNIPFIGESAMTAIIDNGLRRLPCGISTYEDLVRKAKTYRKAANLMDSIFTLDTHCDLPENYSKGWSVGRRNLSQSGVPKMDEGHLDAQVLVSFLWQGPSDDASASKAYQKNLAQIARIREDVSEHSAICALASTPAQADSIKALGKKVFMIALENGYGIGNDIKNIKTLKGLGVIYISLSHFRDNAICNTSSRHGSDPSKGLTAFGREVVEEMNRQGILIDLSHPSQGTFWDCISLSKAPVICSHSGARAVYGHDRGLDDKQLKALAKNGGVIQVYSVPEYLGRSREKMTIDDMMAHFDHCVEVAGAEHVGIGSDFDGGGGVWGCNGDNDLINLTIKMIEHGYSDEQIKGFWGGNFMRVLGKAQAIAGQD